MTIHERPVFFSGPIRAKWPACKAWEQLARPVVAKLYAALAKRGEGE